MIKRKPMVLFFLLFMCFNVHANAGLPMIAVIFPKTVLSLIPIILIETAVLAKTLKLHKKKTVSAVVAGNACSTLFGIPITWAILAYIQISTGGGEFIDGVGDLMKKILSVTWQAPWLMPSDNLYWQVPAATLFLFIPFFFASWLIEFWVELFILKKKLQTKNALDEPFFLQTCSAMCFLQ